MSYKLCFIALLLTYHVGRIFWLIDLSKKLEWYCISSDYVENIFIFIGNISSILGSTLKGWVVENAYSIKTSTVLLQRKLKK